MITWLHLILIAGMLFLNCAVVFFIWYIVHRWQMGLLRREQQEQHRGFPVIQDQERK